MKKNEAIEIYIHIPFCEAHCAYCHFVVDLGRGEIQQRYRDALLREIEHWGARLDSSSSSLQETDSVYIGGGTPSWIDSRWVIEFLQQTRSHFAVPSGAEMTIEINPDSLDERKMDDYLAAGINRASLGIQSFRDEELRRLGRTHTAAQATQAFSKLRRAGFENISVDLIAGLPGQTAEQWEESLLRLGELNPEHLSLYLFDLDEESPLGRKILHSKASVSSSSQPKAGSASPKFALPPEEEVVRIYELAVNRLHSMGFEQYEISNFARRPFKNGTSRSSFQSRHNLKYWNLQPYLGLGCAAHSFLSGQRWHNCDSTDDYIQAVATRGEARVEIEEINASRLAEDAFIFGLRKTEGVSYRELTERLETDARKLFRSVIDPLIADGWLIEEGDRLRLHPKSVLVSNEIFRRFIGAEESPRE